MSDEPGIRWPGPPGVRSRSRATSGVRLRRYLVLAAPAAVPVSMWGVFAGLAKFLLPRRANNVGFATYWGCWCFAFPVWVLGPRRAAVVLRAGRRPTTAEAVLLAVPVLGSVASALLPNLRRVDCRVAAVMVTSATVNAIGEELLWRGLFLEEFPDDKVRGVLWPLVGFSLWHLVPQTILPSRHGRWQFVAGAAVVGAASSVLAWRTGGLRSTLVPHLVVDSCGVAAAEFRLGR